MNYRGEEHTSRRVIDVATGILVGLRGCSEREAFDELVRVVNRTGVGIGSIANGLVALSSGASSAGHTEAFAAWGELVGRSRFVPAASASSPL
ncbi:ANTAR domain-containing protein [Mycobacterium sp. 1274761.0]|uniref:ANTAR domain-containing protein n=1 Tax=Mycobacterium sp. 1274761.0 TaxID=1834077 RepID=UPI0007FEE36B|nr:ANTAR domain-containing protein [Mycobacterium sp. 1274761.0]OBK77290.1 histidine kinase [Mycobacterium sp. 1274761.0]